MNFDEELARVKSQEAREGALMVMEDAGLRQLLTAWPFCGCEKNLTPPGLPLSPARGVTAESGSIAARSGETGEEASDPWEWLWSQVRFDTEKLGEMCGISPGPCKVLVRRAIGMRLIYPDGSVHEFGRKVLQKRLMDQLGL